MYFSIFNSDNNILVSGGTDGMFVWDLKQGKYIHLINSQTRGNDSHDADIECFTWTHKGTTLITG